VIFVSVARNFGLSLLRAMQQQTSSTARVHIIDRVRQLCRGRMPRACASAVACGRLLGFDSPRENEAILLDLRSVNHDSASLLWAWLFYFFCHRIACHSPIHCAPKRLSAIFGDFGDSGGE
jgi:hypothetical protein